ncbi:coniferyl aldehyde dehydrogenase [Spongiibacter nanhainus]|uniref:Aldehyde dehydrogenase n=1 Tax=Spongiibacter nanhainus TaxID=2794344 RepID=A0A7T4UPX4_9GAMM|nr:coniferyl aldehyde dehydrogenase [Spongiibacter nanhainus]QQD18138.1 coniferyl aldehyde dehydrogenase [Spongiibacter nanhainus]
MNSQIPDTGAANHIHTILQKQRAAFQREGAVSAQVRQDRIQRIIDLVFDNREQLVASLAEDFGHRSHHQSLMSDIYATLECLKHSKKHLKSWMKSERRSAPFPMNLLGAKARVEYHPKGVVGIIGTWNFPVNTIFAPLGGVFAAGNRAMIKCSEITPKTGELIETLVKKYFDDEELVAINGGPDVGASFSAAPFDHIIFTGATSIGRHILHAAADNLTPVTLELGGKSPVIIADDYDLQEAVERIINGKILNQGQVCLSPDYIFVPKDKLEDFNTRCMDYLGKLFASILDNPDYTSVVNARHFQRLQAYLGDARQNGADIREFNPANEDFSQQQGAHKIPLTLVINPGDELLVSKEELFGPVIVVRSYEKLQDCLDYVRARPHPLALYYFGNSKSEQRYVLDNSTSGAVTINDVIFHVSCEDLPFGGIGPSGMGNYHGLDGFKTFSHPRAVYTQSKINFQRLGGMIPPYGDKCDKTLKTMIRK